MSQAQLLAEACSGGWNTVGCLAACSQRSCWRRSNLLRAVSRVLSGQVKHIAYSPDHPSSIPKRDFAK